MSVYALLVLKTAQQAILDSLPLFTVSTCSCQPSWHMVLRAYEEAATAQMRSTSICSHRPMV